MLKAVNDRIIVEPEEVQDTITGSGIIIPDTTKAKEQEAVRKGKVLDVGPGMITVSGERVVPKISKGAIIVYQPYAKTELVVNKKTLHIIRWEDVDCEWIDDNKVKS
jgi:chaperonin GroES